DTIVKFNVGPAPAQFLHFKTSSRFVGDKKTFAVSLRSEKHVITDRCVHGLGEFRIQRDCGKTSAQLTRTVILEPYFRSLDRIQLDHGAVLQRHDSRFRSNRRGVAQGVGEIRHLAVVELSLDKDVVGGSVGISQLQGLNGGVVCPGDSGTHTTGGEIPDEGGNTSEGGNVPGLNDAAEGSGAHGDNTARGDVSGYVLRAARIDVTLRGDVSGCIDGRNKQGASELGDYRGNAVGGVDVDNLTRIAKVAGNRRSGQGLGWGKAQNAIAADQEAGLRGSAGAGCEQQVQRSGGRGGVVAEGFGLPAKMLAHGGSARAVKGRRQEIKRPRICSGC